MRRLRILARRLGHGAGGPQYAPVVLRCPSGGPLGWPARNGRVLIRELIQGMRNGRAGVILFLARMPGSWRLSRHRSCAGAWPSGRFLAGGG